MSNETVFLYVEDDATSRKVMEMILVYQMGFSNFTIFEDSTDFANRIEALPRVPDIIFLDIHMKPLDGFEMLKFIREHPKYKNCLVIALTASVMSEEVDRLGEAGFDGTIAKPLNKDQFPKLVEQILAGEDVWFIS